VIRSGRGLSLRSYLPLNVKPKDGCPLRQAGSIRLTPQHSVHVIEYGDQSWLVACSQVGVTLIGEAKPKTPGSGSSQ
jgi:hypothetical protein